MDEMPKELITLSKIATHISIDGMNPYTIKQKHPDFPKGIPSSWRNMPCTKYSIHEIIEWAKSRGFEVNKPTKRVPVEIKKEEQRAERAWIKEKEQLLAQIDFLKAQISKAKPINDELLDLESLWMRRRKFKNKCGIYFLFDGDELVYIGQSVGIEGRVETHGWEGRKKFDYYAYVDCPKEKLSYMETIYILHYKPKYNYNSLGKLVLPMSPTMLMIASPAINP